MTTNRSNTNQTQPFDVRIRISRKASEDALHVKKNINPYDLIYELMFSV